MRVLVACEYSGAVSRAFREQGHEAYSVDLLPADNDCDEPFHFVGDYRDAIAQIEANSGPIDIIIGHPPCTALAVSGNRWYAGTDERREAIDFVRVMGETFDRHARIGWAIENPVGVLTKWWRKPTQYIQPWQFGHGETKKTGLWIEGLPALVPTDIVEGREQRIWKMGPSEDRWKERSKTYTGIARAMAEQWGGIER
jgi:site-specific DNA-cytosine methylase